MLVTYLDPIRISMLEPIGVGVCWLKINLKECCKLEITKRGRSVLIEKPLISMLKFSVNSSAEFLMVLK